VVKISLDRFLKPTQPKPKISPSLAGLMDKIKYKCSCGLVSDYLELIQTRGKCPSCGETLVKLNSKLEKTCGECENFIIGRYALDIGICKITREIKHVKEKCNVF